MRKLVWILAVAVLWCCATAPSQAGTVERVSVSTAGVEGDGDSLWPQISADGRYVAFPSYATNFGEGDTNAAGDVFLRDRFSDTTEWVSVSYTPGESGTYSSGHSVITADGRYVAFISYASDLVSDDTNGTYDAFVWDRDTGLTELVSVSSTGDQSNAKCMDTAISGDGRYVAFSSVASNLVAGVANGKYQVYLHDRQLHTTEGLSLDGVGNPGNDDSGYRLTFMNADGRYVVFESVASNLVPGATNGYRNVFVRDRQLDTTQCASVTPGGLPGDEDSDSPNISADGRYVVFASYADDLVSGDTNGYRDVFVRDLQDQVTEKVSVSSSEVQGDGDSGDWLLGISATGRYVSFTSAATNLVANDNNACNDVFLRDRVNGTTLLVSIDSIRGQGNAASAWSAISANGRFVAFRSEADNLVADDTNAHSDIFIRDMLGFLDVPADFWAANQITACAQAGIVGGYPDGTYHPDEAVTRAQMAVYIARALAGGDSNVPTGPGTATFPDVQTGYWAFKYVEYCYAQGVIGGYWDGYHPEETVNRAQMAVYAARAMAGGDGNVPPGPGSATFPDVPTGYWAFKYVEYCCSSGVVGGYWDGYHPEETVNRAQMAVYVQRAFELPM